MASVTSGAWAACAVAAHALASRSTQAIHQWIVAAQPAVSGAELTSRLSNINGVGRSIRAVTVPVNGYVADRDRSATKTDTPLIETPRSVTVIAADRIESQNATDISEVLRYTSGGVPALRGAGQNRCDLFNLRGFRPDRYLDGVRLAGDFDATPRVDPFLLERVDILEEPASVRYGQTPPRGAVNHGSERPVADARTRVFVQGGSDARVRGGLDIGGKAGSERDLRYRVAAVGAREHGFQATPDTSTFSIAPAVTFRCSVATELSVLANDRNDPEVGSPGALPYVYTVAPRADGSRLKRGFFVGGDGVEVEAGLPAGLDVTAATAYRHSDIERSNQGNANTAEVPDDAVFDGALHYALGYWTSRLEGWKVQLNVHNLFNEKYVAPCLSQAYCYCGEERESTAPLGYS